MIHTISQVTYIADSLLHGTPTVYLSLYREIETDKRKFVVYLIQLYQR
jgi:hypothetical protein